MLLVTVQALGELAVLFPVNGAFFTYVVRFVDPSLHVSHQSFYIFPANIRIKADLLLDGITPLDGLQFSLLSSLPPVLQFSSGGRTSISG